MNLSEILSLATQKGWHVELQDSAEKHIPIFLEPWHTEANSLLFQFLETVEIMENQDQTIWLLCLPDFLNTNNSSFKWDEFKTMSLSSAISKSQINEITEFWNRYLPICISVKNGYSYCAVDLYGNIVVGYEPEFEVPINIELSYEQFMINLINGKIDM